ncbi:bone marrow stromal antigen 2 [Pteronotus mesoamericanus]|uniref:bone marrow stromal antigen 2 n=1 Tax=Pteronotus mesoamericanus TaxID=1884717 RepID=UPI0023EE133E|nr:bone marrow stromal antigen 2 [Pteronotus parnellii mesoamericanus]
MAPTLYHYYLLPVDDDSKVLMLSGRKLPVWVAILLIVLSVVLFITTITFAVMAYSPACKDGHRMEQEWRNNTHNLERQLTQAHEVLRQTEAYAAACNQTAATLMASLETEKAQRQKQQELVQELQGENAELKQKLQDMTAELERLRYNHKNTSNSGNALGLSVVPVLLALSLPALLT